jgi:gliding motility-associated-like protein
MSVSLPLGSTYLWQDEIYKTSGLYSYNVADAIGCKKIEYLDLSIGINNLTEETDLFIPNAISPNGDGINDFFQIFPPNDDDRKVTSLQIFNRWGQVVFEVNKTTDINNINGMETSIHTRPMRTYIFTSFLFQKLTDQNYLQELCTYFDS